VQRLLKGSSGPPTNCCTALRLVIACTSEAASEEVFMGKYWPCFIGITLIRPPAYLSLYSLQHHGVFTTWFYVETVRTNATPPPTLISQHKTHLRLIRTLENESRR
jgi:hypothetical protein